MAYGGAPSPVSLLILFLYAAAFMIIANMVVVRRKNL